MEKRNQIEAASAIDYIPVLDSVRFMAALCVLLHHTIGVPLRVTPFGWNWVPPFLGSLWFGSAAVVIFFVISGYCVHAPYRNGKSFSPPEFLIRRICRITLPLLAALCIAALSGVSYHPVHGMITWSLVCEIIYYVGYAVVVWLALERWLPALTIVSLGTGYILLYKFPMNAQSSIFALIPTILTYAPAWIGGCWLAHRGIKESSSAVYRLIWRSVVLFSSVGLGMLHYTDAARLEWTLPLFPIVILPWMMNEICSSRRKTWFARQGIWSYSLYLVHPAAFHLFVVAFGVLGFSLITVKIPAIVATVLFAYVFYRLIEQPSHTLVRRLAGWVWHKWPVHASVSLQSSPTISP